MSNVECRISNGKSIRTGMTDRVRAACKKLRAVDIINLTRRNVYYEVDPEAGQEYRSFERTWQDLIDRGELVKSKSRSWKNLYRYIEHAAPRANVREKIYRAMHIKGAFCAGDIKKLTDADQSYISAVIRRLAKAGDLELTGKNGKFKIYRVKNGNDFYLKFINKKNGTANGHK